MKRFIVLLMSLLMLTVITVSANEQSTADVVFKLTSEEANIGDEVKLTLSVKSDVNINSIALADFEYDTDSLEFLGFENCYDLSGITSLPPNFDSSRKAIVIGFKKTQAHSLDLCTVNFKVKDNAECGTYSVKAKTTVAKATSKVYTSEFVAGNITVSAQEPVKIKGTSLVLDGAIGVKTYIDIDESVVDLSKVSVITKVYDALISEVVDSRRKTTDNGLMYDAEKGLYCVITYVAPKDADNREIRMTIEYTADGELKSSECPAVNIPDYIEIFRELASAPDTDYSDALNLVNAMDTYIKNADNYFGNSSALEDVVVDQAVIDAIARPAVSGTLSDVEFYATSIVLDNKTTIRHYFKATDEAVAKNTFSIGNKTLNPKRKGNSEYVYVDIEDIPAHGMDERYVLSVSGKLNVTYSVLNYIKLAMAGNDARLKNLVGSLYNYYYQASLFANK